MDSNSLLSQGEEPTFPETRQLKWQVMSVASHPGAATTTGPLITTGKRVMLHNHIMRKSHSPSAKGLSLSRSDICFIRSAVDHIKLHIGNTYYCMIILNK